MDERLSKKFAQLWIIFNIKNTQTSKWFVQFKRGYLVGSIVCVARRNLEIALMVVQWACIQFQPKGTAHVFLRSQTERRMRQFCQTFDDGQAKA